MCLLFKGWFFFSFFWDHIVSYYFRLLLTFPHGIIDYDGLFLFKKLLDLCSYCGEGLNISSNVICVYVSINDLSSTRSTWAMEKQVWEVISKVLPAGFLMISFYLFSILHFKNFFSNSVIVLVVWKFSVANYLVVIPFTQVKPQNMMGLTNLVHLEVVLIYSSFYWRPKSTFIH